MGAEHQTQSQSSNQTQVDDREPTAPIVITTNPPTTCNTCSESIEDVKAMKGLEKRRSTVDIHGHKVKNTYRGGWGSAFRVRGTVVLKVVLPSLFFSGWAALIVWLTKDQGVNLGIPNTLISAISIVVGLLLVFRTNTAYDRYWEGRRTWSNILLQVRNQSRFIWISVKTNTEEDMNEKRGAMNLLVAFAVSVKHFLRSEFGYHYQDLKPLISHLPKLSGSDCLPLEIAHHISAYIQTQRAQDNIDGIVQGQMMTCLNNLVDAFTQLERILTSPIPLAYAAHLKQILILFCFAFPFQSMSTLNYGVVPLTAIVAFTLFGVEAIGGEIENPFGYDANDLPLDKFCEVLREELSFYLSQPMTLNCSDWKVPESPDLDNSITIKEQK